MKNTRINKSLLTLSLIALFTLVCSVSVFAYYKLTVTNKDNVIKAGTISSDVEVYVESTSGTYYVKNKTLSETYTDGAVQCIKVENEAFNDINSLNFNLLGGKCFVVVKSKEASISFSGCIQSGNGMPSSFSTPEVITTDGVLFELAEGYNTYWTKASKADLKAECIFTSDKVIELGSNKVKLDQDLPAAPTLASVSSSGVELNAVGSGHGTTEYGMSSTSGTIPTTWQTSTSFSGLESGTTYYFFARFTGDDEYNEAISKGTIIKTTFTWNSLSTEITTSTGKTKVNYYPVFADKAVPENISFAYKSDEVYIVIENPTMSNLATYANAGTLYYSGNGTLVTVRSINDTSYNEVWNVSDGASYPYYASCAYGDLNIVIKEKIATDGLEVVEKLVMESSGVPSSTPTINGVALANVWNAYNSAKNDSGFGGQNGIFLSCVAESSVNAKIYNYNDNCWKDQIRASKSGNVLISRTFN